MAGIRISLVLAVLSGLVQAAFAAETCIYPVNAFYFSMVHPDGRIQMFERVGFGGEELAGEYGWTGKVEGRRIQVSAPGGNLGRAGTWFAFEDGLQKGAGDPPPARAGLASLFPTEQQKQKLVEDFASSADIWSKSGRLRFLSQNPNISGLFAAEVVIVLLGLLFRARNVVLRVLLAGAELLALWTVYLTESRSAVLSGGLAVVLMLVLKLHRHFTWRRILAVLLPLAVVLVTMFLFHVGDRFSRQLVTNSPGDVLRVDMLKALPAMVADSPAGVGIGNAGATFTTWYDQDIVPRPKRTLISSHFTWFAEFGTAGRLLYAFGWFVLLLGLPVLAFRGIALPATGLWVCLFLAAFFNPVLENWLVWVIPTLALLSVCMRFGCVRLVGVCRLTVGAAVLSCALLLAVTHYGKSHPGPLPIRVDAHSVKVNGDAPETWVAGDEFVVGGWVFVGREFQEYYLEFTDAGAIGYVESLDALPPEVPRLVLTGSLAAQYVERWQDPAQRTGLCKAKSILFLSPSIPVSAIPQDLVSSVRVRAVVGVLAARQDPEYDGSVPEWTRLVRGALLYIPRWVAVAMDF